MKNEMLIALVSAASAVVSGMYAFSSARTARRMYNIVKAEYIEKSTSISAYLIDSAYWKHSSDMTIVAFAVRLDNSANAPNSISIIELITHLHSDSSRSTKLVLEPCTEPGPPYWRLDNLSNVINLNPRSSLSGSIAFTLPSVASSSRRIEKYELVFTTSLGDRTIIESHILRRRKDAVF